MERGGESGLNSESKIEKWGSVMKAQRKCNEGQWERQGQGHLGDLINKIIQCVRSATGAARVLID